MPVAVDVAKALAITDFAKADLRVEGATRRVRGQDLGLERPVTFLFGRRDQRIEKGCADTLAICFRTDVDADLSDTGGASSVRNRCQG